MSGETIGDSGNGEGNISGGSTVQGTFLLLHERLKSVSVAWSFPASGENPGTVFLIHPEGDQYMFVKRFEDRSINPKVYDAKVEDGQVLLNAKDAPTDEQFEKFGAETAAKYMNWQDFSGFSLPNEEDQQDFSRCFADFLTALEDGTLAPLDLSAVIDATAQ